MNNKYQIGTKVYKIFFDEHNKMYYGYDIITKFIVKQDNPSKIQNYYVLKYAPNTIEYWISEESLMGNYGLSFEEAAFKAREKYLELGNLEAVKALETLYPNLKDIGD